MNKSNDQSYRDYLEDVSQQVRWVDRVRFRRALRQAVPGLVQQGSEGETLLSLLVANFCFSPFSTVMDEGGSILRDAAEHCVASSAPTLRCLFALTSHNLHAFPFLSPTVTTFTPDQIFPLWRINNGTKTIEIPYYPAKDLALIRAARPEDRVIDPLPHLNFPSLKAIILCVDPQDWTVANTFWSLGLAATTHWEDPGAILRHFESVMRSVTSRDGLK